MDKTHMLAFMREINSKAIDGLLEKGHVTPAMVFIKKDKGIVVPGSFETPDEKEAFKEMMRFLGERLRPEAVIWVGEAWVANATKGVPLEGPVSQHPDRKECILIAGSNPETTVALMTTFQREGQSFKLEQTEETEGMEDSFTGFIRKQVLSGTA